MKGYYTSTAKAGLIKVALRFIEDPNRNLFARLFLAVSPLLLIYIISPLDIVPEIVLGPLGLADDGAILFTLFFIMRFARSFYVNTKYTPTNKLEK
jgi:uncharacterized membrane protein YkvA (DUF1232 family)